VTRSREYRNSKSSIKSNSSSHRNSNSSKSSTTTNTSSSSSGACRCDLHTCRYYDRMHIYIYIYIAAETLTPNLPELYRRTRGGMSGLRGNAGRREGRQMLSDTLVAG
jgi:hypothetical protein